MMIRAANPVLMSFKVGGDMPLNLPDAPFVGYAGSENTLSVINRGGDIVCHVTTSSVAFAQFIVVAFGTALTAALWYSWTHPTTARMPWPFAIVAVFLTLACWLVFFRNLAGTPHFEVKAATGDVELYRRRTREPWKTIPAGRISHFNTSKQFYVYKSSQTENAVLTLFTIDGERVPLCASPDEALIRSLAEQIGRLTGRTEQSQ